MVVWDLNLVRHVLPLLCIYNDICHVEHLKLFKTKTKIKVKEKEIFL